MPWGLQALQLYFGWAGHVARMEDGRIVKQIAQWRCLDWFRIGQTWNSLDTGEDRIRIAK